MGKLVLIRHGESQWNLENRFTGWEDISLTEKGKDEAKKAGKFLKEQSFQFQRAYTSYLKRAIHTLWMVLSECEQSWIPVFKNWRLNERHYGGLQGLNKDEIKKKYGKDTVFKWRRSYDVSPLQSSGDQDHLLEDRRYKNVQIPKGESLKETLQRVVPYWDRVILPGIEEQEKENKTSINILIVAHGNSLRGLVKYLTDMDEEKIVNFEFVTGVPLICEMDQKNKIVNMNWGGVC